MDPHLLLRTGQFTLTVLAGLLSACSSTQPLQSPHSPKAYCTMNEVTNDESRPPATSPITLEELGLLQESLLWSEDDAQALRQPHDILKPQTEDILDVWYGFVASTPQLVKYFSNAKTGQPDGNYLAAVRVRFGQWISDTAKADYNQEWLNYQYEIGLRHHSIGKNKTDGVDSVPIIHLRYIPALAYPITATLKPFLAKGGASQADVERMHQAWIKSVLLQSILWSQPYVKAGEF